MLMLSLLLACSKTTAPAGGTPPSPAARASADSPTADAPSSPDWVGTWTSPSCGDRSYERRIELTADQRANVEERISPCPPDAQCMWSGVVVFEGTYITTGDQATLALGQPLGAPAGGPELVDVPATLTFKAGALHQGSCAYTR